MDYRIEYEKISGKKCPANAFNYIDFYRYERGYSEWLEKKLNQQCKMHNKEYIASLEAIIKEGFENDYAVQEIVLAVQRLNSRS